MKQKLLTLLTLLLCAVTSSWADDYTLEASKFDSDQKICTVNGLDFSLDPAHGGTGQTGYGEYIKFSKGKTYKLSLPSNFQLTNINIKGYTNSNGKTNGEITSIGGVAQTGKTFPAKDDSNLATQTQITDGYDFAISQKGGDVSIVAANTNQICVLITLTGTASDETKPTFSLTTPATTTDVAIDSRSVVLTASEDVTKVGTDVTGTLKIGDAAASAINYVFDSEAMTLTYTFATDLAYSTTYAFTVDASQVKDGADNENDETAAFSFTTEANIPAAITAVSPNGGSVNGKSTVTVDAVGTVYYQWSDNSTATIGVGEWNTGAITVPNEAGTKYLHVYAYKTAENISAVTTTEFNITKVASAVTLAWDFTKALSATDVANLTADTNWSYTEGSKRWTGGETKLADNGNYITLQANGENLEIVDGLLIGRSGNNLQMKFIRIDDGQRFQFNGPNGLIKIPNLEAGDVIEVNFASAGSSAGDRKLTASSNATLTSATGSNVSNINTDVKTAKFTVSADGDAVLTNPDNGLNFFYIKVYQSTPAVEVTVPATGYATYVNYDKALDFTNTDITAYVVKYNTETSVTLEEKGQVAAGEPVLLKVEGGKADVAVPVIASATADGDNLLVAGAANGSTKVTYDAGAGEYNYILWTNGSSVTGFYRANNSPIAAGKAYLHVTTPSTASFFSLDDDVDMTTNIAELEAKRNLENGNVYNLAGQRVSQPTKGLYIVNGKKVVIK